MPKNTNSLAGNSGRSMNVVLTVIAVVVAVLVIGGVLMSSGGDGNQRAGADTVPAELLRKPDSHTLTEAPESPVTVVEFLDYQCSACAQYYSGVTKQIEQDYQGRINFVARNFPLEMHALAVPAARAAEAAALQGKYREMYHALFDNYESWAVAPDGQKTSEDTERARAAFDTFASRIGLDLDRFHRDMNSPEVTSRIERDRADGEKAGVSSTPSIYVNGKMFQPSGQTVQEVSAQLRSEIDKELAR